MATLAPAASASSHRSPKPDPGHSCALTKTEAGWSSVNRYSSTATSPSRLPAPSPGTPSETVNGSETGNVCGGVTSRSSATLSSPYAWLDRPAMPVAETLTSIWLFLCVIGTVTRYFAHGRPFASVPDATGVSSPGVIVCGSSRSVSTLIVSVSESEVQSPTASRSKLSVPALCSGNDCTKNR